MSKKGILREIQSPEEQILKDKYIRTLKRLGLAHKDIMIITGLKRTSIASVLAPKRMVTNWNRLVVYVIDHLDEYYQNKISKIESVYQKFLTKDEIKEAKKEFEHD